MRNEPRLAKSRVIAAIGFAVFSLQVGPAAPPPATAATQEKATAAKLSFEVASIKPSEADMHMVRIGASPGGRWTASGITLKMLIQQAFDVRDYQISGLPGWASTDRYDINAKAENPNPTREQIREMLQSMLEERFRLKFRRETKELPVYVLVVGKDGHKLKVSETQPPADGASPSAGKPGASVAGDGTARGTGVGSAGAAGGVGGGTGAVGRGGGSGTIGGIVPRPGQAMMAMGGGTLSAQGVPVSSLVNMLAQQLGRPVVDRTGLKGNYDFSLNWTPDQTHSATGLGTEVAPPPADTSGPSVFTAVQEQLGLKLESEKGPVEILAIVSVEKPSGN